MPASSDVDLLLDVILTELMQALEITAAVVVSAVELIKHW